MFRKRAIPVITVVLAVGACGYAASVYDIREFGAKDGGEILCTKSIQAAIDQCASVGGGTVYLPNGRWLCGTVYLESNVTLFLEAGCTLLGSKDPNDYGRSRTPMGDGKSYALRSIIAGANVQNVSVTGSGMIDGQGSAFRYKGGGRPKAIHLEDCQDVTIEKVRMKNAGSWMQHYRNCDRVTIRDIRVFNHATYNNDGLNIDSCRDVCISRCMVDSDDDAIVLKSLSTQPCRNVTISNCIVSSHCNAIKMGTESGGGFQDITVTNCTICSPRYSKVTYGRQRGLAGLALEIVDGGRLDRVAISNVTIQGVSVPIFMRLGNRARVYESGRPTPGIGTFQNVTLSNIVATDTSEIGCSITGVPGAMIRNVSLSDVQLHFDGGADAAAASRDVAEKEDSYPESTMFGTLPAYGFFCRHVENLTLRNVQLRTAKPDQRHAIVLDDVRDALVDTLGVTAGSGSAATLRLVEARDVWVRGCKAPPGTGTFLEMHGSRSAEVRLTGNDLRHAARTVQRSVDVPEEAVIASGNLLP